MTGSRAENLVVVLKKLNKPQEVPEVDEEVGEDLEECLDHRPSSFERGKPRSILILLLYKSNPLYMSYILLH
jgi:hypothetical protein